MTGVPTKSIVQLWPPALSDPKEDFISFNHSNLCFSFLFFFSFLIDYVFAFLHTLSIHEQFALNKTGLIWPISLAGP